MLLLEVRNDYQEWNESLEDSDDLNEELGPIVPDIDFFTIHLIEYNEHEIDQHHKRERKVWHLSPFVS